MSHDEDSGALFGLLHAARDAGLFQGAAEAVGHLVAQGAQGEGPRQIAGHADPLLTSKFLNECGAAVAAEATRYAAARWGSTLPDVIARHLAKALDGLVPGVSRSQAMLAVRRHVREDLRQDVVLARSTPVIDMVAWQILSYLSQVSDVERVLEKLMCGELHLAHTSEALFNRGETLIALALSAAGGGQTSSVYRQWQIEELAIVARWATGDGVVERVARVAAGIAPDHSLAGAYDGRIGECPAALYMREAMKRCAENGWTGMRHELGRRAAFDSLSIWASEATTLELGRWAKDASEKRTTTPLESVFSFDTGNPELCDAVCQKCSGIAGLIFTGDHATGYAVGRTLTKWCHTRSQWQLALALAPEWAGTIDELGKAVSLLSSDTDTLNT